MFSLASIVTRMLCAVTLLAVGCSTLPDRTDYDVKDLQDAHLVGYPPEIRTWGDGDLRAFQRTVTNVRAQQARSQLRQLPLDVLALSGGGEDGAFGAGLLVGWSERGDRPMFEVVTGVSTGSLIAPFAFLGSSYDPQLREAYTTIDSKNVLLLQNIIAILTGESIATTAPLRELIGRFVTPELMQAVATEHNKGRRLFVVTTNLDFQRPVLWNMGRIANSGNPKAAELFRDVLVASASIPAVFPPVYFDVQSGDRRFKEMHVDGGVTAQVFSVPMAAAMSTIRSLEHRQRNIYVVINNRVAPQFDMPQRSLLSIAGRSISTMIKMQGASGTRDLYYLAEALQAEYHLAYIGDDFTEVSPRPFDRGYMNKLFAYGYELGRRGYPWKKLPPGMDPNAGARTRRSQ
jgi:predicted acylesterase/phospholipase RssA